MLKSIYKRILLKLDLDKAQLAKLAQSLNSYAVCAGGFVDGTKMCPNTKALAIKTGKKAFDDKNQIKQLFKKHNVSLFELSFLFYLLYDLPAMLSDKAHEHLLNKLRKSANDLIKTK